MYEEFEEIGSNYNKLMIPYAIVLEFKDGKYRITGKLTHGDMNSYIPISTVKAKYPTQYNKAKATLLKVLNMMVNGIAANTDF